MLMTHSVERSSTVLTTPTGHSILLTTIAQFSSRSSSVQCSPYSHRPLFSISTKCPITCDMMDDPVICADGHTYDRHAIERWLSQHGTSPKTNARLPSREVISNHNLRSLIEQFRAKHG